MNILLIIFSLFFLVGNYFAYREKISPLICFLWVICSELGAAFSLLFYFGYSQNLLIIVALVLAFTCLSMIITKILPNLHLLIWMVIAFLVQSGTFMLFRISPKLAIRHIIICIVGLLLIFPIYVVVRYFNSSYKFGLVYFALAVVLLLMNNVTRYGARNWTQIGNFVYQPSEFVKILFSMFLASYLLRPFKYQDFIKASMMSFLVIGILVFQRDLGGAFIFYTIYMVITYMYSRKKLLLVGQIGLASLGGITAYFLFSHVKVRIISWLHPFAYANNEGFQLVRSLQAIMNGKWFGMGLGQGNPSRIPVVTSDFLFAAIAEEYGSLYLLLFVLHFVFLILLLYNQCLKSKNKFYFYTGTSLTTMLAIQGFLIMAGGTGMIPLTGVVLPFVSYGGSAMIGNFMIVGMIENMTKFKPVNFSDSPYIIKLETMQKKKFRKYIRLLKFLIFVIYLSFSLYLVWLFVFWKMPVLK